MRHRSNARRKRARNSLEGVTTSLGLVAGVACAAAASWLVVTATAQANIAASVYRPLFAHAVDVAGRCPGLTAGRYVVEVVLSDARREAHLTTAPTSDEATRRCVENAFAAEAYPVPAGGAETRIVWPFVVR